MTTSWSRPGEVLVRIDPRDYQARVDQACAALAAAESQARGAAGRRSADRRHDRERHVVRRQAQVAAADSADPARAADAVKPAAPISALRAKANVEAAQATYDRARADLARMKPLVDKARNLAAAVRRLHGRRARRDSQLQRRPAEAARPPRRSRPVTKPRWSPRRREIEEARAVPGAVARESQAGGHQRGAGVVSRRRPSSRRAPISRPRSCSSSYTTIMAPIDGVVTKKTIQLGQIMQPGQSLMTIVPLSDVWVTANFKETQLADVQSGQRAEMSRGHLRPDVRRPRGLDRRRHRHAPQSAAARKRHRQLREDRAAHPGEDRARSAARTATCSAPA